jgi:hypothetical protein
MLMEMDMIMSIKMIGSLGWVLLCLLVSTAQITVWCRTLIKQILSKKFSSPLPIVGRYLIVHCGERKDKIMEHAWPARHAPLF